MPWSGQTYCLEVGCGEIVPKGRCRRHAKQHAEAVQARREARETWRDYGSPAWRHARQQVLAREPNCRSCGAEATHVDHVVRLQDGGTHDIANLQPLCASCHGLKTYNETIRAARERQRKRNAKG
jgi:5-methylcytosine-specific restriction protein A